jgi:hypothetical protein
MNIAVYRPQKTEDNPPTACGLSSRRGVAKTLVPLTPLLDHFGEVGDEGMKKERFRCALWRKTPNVITFPSSQNLAVIGHDGTVGK